jgi:nucleotide-binding universal stress UspA family protein
MSTRREVQRTPAATVAAETGTQTETAAIQSVPAECILLATNGSAESNAALRFASAYAAREELLLRILTVLEPLPMLPAQPSGITYAMTIERERGDTILATVRAQLAALGSAPRSLTSMLVGSPGATIADAAREWNAQYIVVGAGRRGTLERLLSGDTVARILRRAAAPVIAVPSTVGELPSVGVVGVDFGVASLTAVRRAASLLGGDGVLHLLHIRPDIDIPATDPDAWGEIYQLGAAALMARLTTDLATEFPGLRVETALERGHAPTVLLGYADRVHADLIAVGQHGHGVVDRFLFGSVAQEMVRSAKCAVVVTPPARESE